MINCEFGEYEGVEDLYRHVFTAIFVAPLGLKCCMVLLLIVNCPRAVAQ